MGPNIVVFFSEFLIFFTGTENTIRELLANYFLLRLFVAAFCLKNLLVISFTFWNLMKILEWTTQGKCCKLATDISGMLHSPVCFFVSPNFALSFLYLSYIQNILVFPISLMNVCDEELIYVHQKTFSLQQIL